MRQMITALTISWFFAINAAAADQTDTELHQLFEQLKRTTDLVEMANVQNDIWARWYELPEGAESVQDDFDAGMRALNLSMPMTAIDYFTAVIEAAPEFAEAWNRRATTYYMIGDFEAALRDIQQTLILEPRHFGALSGLSMIFEQSGDLARALAAEQLLLQLIPHDPRIQSRVAAFETALGAGKI